LRWVPDRTGRFAKRPHYDPAELDSTCEAVLNGFLLRRNRAVTFPVATDDLIVLLEHETEDLDIYADLSGKGSDIEGVTSFQRSGKPRVQIARALTEEAHAIHRFRTTATHELGHVIFHSVLWHTEGHPSSLFPEYDVEVHADSPECKRGALQPLSRVDWMEWQAGYACGAFLMPANPLHQLVAGWRADANASASPWVDSEEGRQLIQLVARSFEVSRQAASVRLDQLKLVVAVRADMATLF
jgi:Zn-dependent peptidase ImmA (M78 family)